MPNDTEKIEQRPRAGSRRKDWMERLKAYDLPDWQNLPELDLYMDQVVLLLTRYLSPMCDLEDERPITASIINNYVRMKIMPPPVKKKYSRVHIAYLVIICTLKQSLSISCIQRLLPEESSEGAVREAYTQFVERYRAASAFVRSLSDAGSRQLLDGGDFVMTAAILSTLSKSLTEFLLREDEDKYED